MSDPKSLKFKEVLMTETPEPVTFEIVWTIPNFSYFKQQTSQIESKPRIIGKSSWCLTLFPLKKAEENGAAVDAVGLYLKHKFLETGSNWTLQTRFKLGVADKNHMFVKDHTLSAEYTFSSTAVFPGYGFQSLVAHSALFGPDSTLLVNDKLILRAEVKYLSLNVVAPKSSETEELPRATDRDVFQQSFHYLYTTDIGHDFVLVSSDGIETPAHRAVLICRSPVFSAMFGSNLTECRSGRCEISDVDSGTLAVLVKYMYCGCPESELKSNTEKILVAADKYQLTALVDQCEKLLIENVSEENLVDLLVLSEQTTTPALKDAVCNFIRVSGKGSRATGLMKEICEKASAEYLEDIMQRLF